MEDCFISQSTGLSEYENQTLKASAADSCSYVKFHCPVAHQDVSSVSYTVHDCELNWPLIWVNSGEKSG